MKRWIGGSESSGLYFDPGERRGIGHGPSSRGRAHVRPPRSGLRSSTVVFGFVGIVMTILGFKMFDALIKFNLAEEICEKQNIAAALLLCHIAIGIIIAVAVHRNRIFHMTTNST